MLTINDIAKIARCSPSTVSKALNNKSDVSEKTKIKIKKIAQENNFKLHQLADIDDGKTENIGIVFCREEKPLSGNPFYSRVLEGIEGELVLNNYNLILTLLAKKFSGDVPKMIRDKKVDGLIIVGIIDKNFTTVIKKYDLPIILVDPTDYTMAFKKVVIDNEQGGFLATNHMINRGHKRIAFVSGSLDRASFKLRFQGYKNALEMNGIPVNKSLVKAGGIEEGYEYVEELMALPEPPTAIFFGNDTNALLGYKAISDAGLKIPEDISVAGFDDIAMAKYSEPPLTTIKVYKEELGSLAVRKLLDEIKNPNTDDIAVTTVMPVKLIERDSVKKLI